MSANANASASGWNDAGERAQGSSLAGAVRTDQTHDLPRLNREREFAHGDEFPVKLGQAFDLNHFRTGFGVALCGRNLTSRGVAVKACLLRGVGILGAGDVS